MAQAEYGYYTLALTLWGIANVLSDLGLTTAITAVGGPRAQDRGALGRLHADAQALHRRLAGAAFALLIPGFAAMLWHQQAGAWQVATLTLLIAAASALHVRAGLGLSIARLLGEVGLQQKLDLALHGARLVVLWVAAQIALDAEVACLVNLGVALACFVVLKRHLQTRLAGPAPADGEHTAALCRHLRQQAPNCIYYVLSSQLAVGLIGAFGNADRVAEVGALGRLAAVFSVVGAVSAALVQPYFARREGPAELAAGFATVNAFFAVLLAALLAWAAAFPASILWLLGSRYAGLQAELGWMVAAATLSAWGGTIYTIGCARGWVMPVGLVIASGTLSTAIAVSLVDVATVRGSFMINTATGLAGAASALAYFGWRLRRHARAALP
jgi:hypothetical protein